MKLHDLMKELSYGEFANLAVGESGSGEIAEKKIIPVVLSINSALLRIYSKFLFKHSSVKIKKQFDKTKYVLDSAYAESTNAIDPYIIDATDPFKNDVIRIIDVKYRCPKTNSLFHAHQYFYKDPVYVSVPKTIIMPDSVPVGTILTVNYRASHPIVDYDENTEIEIPPSAYEAVKAYVASNEYSSMNTDVAAVTAAGYLNKFERICGEIVDRDSIGITEEFTKNTFEVKGFV